MQLWLELVFRIRKRLWNYISRPRYQERVEHIVDLTKLENKPIDEKLFENGNSFTLELPNSKRVLVSNY